MTSGDSSATPSDAAQASALAHQYGLTRVDLVPTFGDYVRQLWRRRSFISELAVANAYSRNQNNYLGQLWATLNPLMLAGSYFLIFGLLLKTDRGVENFIAYLTIGIFIFSFIAASVTAGAKAITGNQNLIRALRFPRASLPIAVVMAEILTLLPALGVLMVLLPLTGEPVRVDWLLIPVAVLLLFAFCTGAGMLAARLVTASRDMLNLIPVAVRLLRYVSGVFYSIAAYADTEWIRAVLQYQPVAVYLDLMRSLLLAEQGQDLRLWLFGIGWAFLFLIVGSLLFWRAEQHYGRG